MEQEQIVNISEMDWRTLPKSAVIIAVGAPESGKTFLFNFLLYALKHIYPVAAITCGTEATQRAFGPTIGDLFVRSDYSKESQELHATRQKLCVQNGIEPYMIEILDDCSDNTKIYNDPIMISAFKNGRQHLKRLFLIGLQYGIDLKPALRKCVSYAILFREPEEPERKKLYENFGGICGSQKVFNELMDKFTDKYTCLIFKKGGSSNKLEDCVFWFKAPAWRWRSDNKLHPYPEGWRFGCDEFKKWNDKRYNKSYVEKFF